jgi:hypothetical protein
VNEIELLRILAPVAGDPFLRIASGSDVEEIHCRGEHAGLLLFREIREGKLAGIETGAVLSHDGGERAHPGGPRQVGEGTGLDTALEDALMDRPELVHVIALVGAAPGVEEGNAGGDQERRSVMRYRVWTREQRDDFAVVPFAIGEEGAVLGGEPPAQSHALADEAALQRRPAVHGGAGEQDEPAGDHPGADQARILGVAGDGSLLELQGTPDGRAGSDRQIGQSLAVQDPAFPLDVAPRRALRLHVGADQSLGGSHKLRIVAI